jgi:hypothetical protein
MNKNMIGYIFRDGRRPRLVCENRLSQPTPLAGPSMFRTALRTEKRLSLALHDFA